jgi:hypothetical protein
MACMIPRVVRQKRVTVLPAVSTNLYDRSPSNSSCNLFMLYLQLSIIVTWEYGVLLMNISAFPFK